MWGGDKQGFAKAFGVEGKFTIVTAVVVAGYTHVSELKKL